MAGMIVLILVVDTCLTVALAARLSRLDSKVRKLANTQKASPEEADED